MQQRAAIPVWRQWKRSKCRRRGLSCERGCNQQFSQWLPPLAHDGKWWTVFGRAGLTVDRPNEQLAGGTAKRILATDVDARLVA